MSRSLRLELPLVLSALFAMACTDGTYVPDAGPGLPPVTDIGTPCYCELDEAGTACKQAPTNTCKSGMTCVIHGTPNGTFNNAGNILWESPLFRRNSTTPDGGAQIEGECTLVFQPTDFNRRCPDGASLVVLSSGHYVCKRTCESDAQCGRSGWVCDAPFLNVDALSANPPQELPLDAKICRPACEQDFPDCNRSTWCRFSNTQPGVCQRSGLTPGAPADYGIYIGDRFGTRTCNQTTGKCQDTAFRTPNNGVGGQCVTNEDCMDGLLCVGDNLYASVPDGIGFCAMPGCTIGVAAPNPGSCPQGLSCEWAFEMTMCFPDCQGGTVCGGAGQVCDRPLEQLAWSYVANGALASFAAARCVDCDITATGCQ